MKNIILLTLYLTSAATQAHSPESVHSPMLHEILHAAPLLLTLVLALLLATAFREKIQKRIKQRFFSE